MGTTCITSQQPYALLVTVAQIEKELDTNNLEIKERTGCCQIEMNRKSKAKQTTEWNICICITIECKGIFIE